MSFAEIADQRHMTAAKRHLGELTWDVDPDPFQLLRASSSADVESLLRLLTRRGLDPATIGFFFEAFPDRPIERALVAWDVARGSLLGPDDSVLAARLATELAPFKSLGIHGAVAVPRDRVSALIDAVRRSGDVAPLLDEFATMPSLAALAGLAGVRNNLDDKPQIIEAVLAHTKQLAMAHLPSLAVSFLQILWDRFALPQALDLLVELGLDHHLLDSIPTMSGQDDRSMQVQTYLLVRSSLDECYIPGATKWLASLDMHPGVRSATDPSLLLTRAHLALLNGDKLDAADVKMVVNIAIAGSRWRYAAAVRDMIAMQHAPGDAAQTLDQYISTFGNDVRAWAQASLHDEARPALLTLLSRELRYGSHEPNAWRALPLFVGDETIESGVEQRLKTQLTEALS